MTLIICSAISGQTTKPTNYKIEIRLWGLLIGGDKTWTITQDSISIIQKNFKDSTDTYSKMLSSADNQRIIETLTKVDLRKIKNEYVNNSAPDDMGEYDFKITVDTQTKEFHIYRVKVDEIFNLVKQINGLLPDKYQIGYNVEYIGHKK